MDEWRKHDGADRQGQQSMSRLARFRWWLAGYYELETISCRENDRLLRDADLSREAARDSLRPWRIIGFLLLPRSGRD